MKPTTIKRILVMVLCCALANLVNTTGSDAARSKKRHAAKKARKAAKKSAKPMPTPGWADSKTDEVDVQTPVEPQQAAAPAPVSADEPLQRGARVEFDGRLVQGQVAKSGAIYLFARKRSDPQSMVHLRTDYRREILKTVYPDQ